MLWNGTRNAGFSTAEEAALWLPVSPEYPTLNVEAQLADPTSMLELVRALLALRKRSDALRRGAYAEHPAGDEHCLVHVRESGDDRLVVALNLTDRPRHVALGGEIVLSTGLDRHGERVAGAFVLRPDEGVIARP
jgi:alpha-glucosidase